MSRYARGDDTAFDLVYEAVAPRLERYLGRRVPARASVEDIVQQTFLQMHAARGTFIGGAAVMPWAYAIARRLMIDAGRASRREQPLGIDDELRSPVLAGVIPAGGSSPSSELVVEAEETHAQLTAAYERLSPPQRDAFDLVKIEGLPYADAAAVLGTTITGVKLRVHRVHLALRRALGGPLARRAPARGLRRRNTGPLQTVAGS
jgi:RNA polymerase sigma-70 factor (ECF subfamily)